MEQEAVFDFLAVVETLQADIKRIGAAGELEGRPGHHLGVGADSLPDGRQVAAAAQRSAQAGIVGFGIDFVAHFNQQGDILVRSKAGIQAKFGSNRGKIGLIVLLKSLQAGLQALVFRLLCLVKRLGFGQTSFCRLQSLLTALYPALRRPQTLARLAQLTGGRSRR